MKDGHQLLQNFFFEHHLLRDFFFICKIAELVPQESARMCQPHKSLSLRPIPRAWITSSVSRKVSSSVSCQHHILKPVSLNPCLWMCCVQGKILEQKTQHSFLVIFYSAKGAPHCSFSSISIILIPFWTPCLKNDLAKDSKTQLRKPAPVIEILPF